MKKNYTEMSSHPFSLKAERTLARDEGKQVSGFLCSFTGLTLLLASFDKEQDRPQYVSLTTVSAFIVQ